MNGVMYTYVYIIYLHTSYVSYACNSVEFKKTKGFCRIPYHSVAFQFRYLHFCGMQGINERIAKLLPDGAVMPHNSEMVMISVDCTMSGNLFHVTEID